MAAMGAEAIGTPHLYEDAASGRRDVRPGCTPVRENAAECVAA
jgi:hypothetical protein